MKGFRSFLSVLLLLGALGFSASQSKAASVLFQARLVGTNYCHMKFPAIREATLSWDRPVLKDASSGDIIDFYGSCNHDPLGEEEIERQRLHLQRQMRQDGE